MLYLSSKMKNRHKIISITRAVVTNMPNAQLTPYDHDKNE